MNTDQILGTVRAHLDEKAALINEKDDVIRELTRRLSELEAAGARTGALGEEKCMSTMAELFALKEGRSGELKKYKTEMLKGFVLMCNPNVVLDSIKTKVNVHNAAWHYISGEGDAPRSW
jgi:hypothetical protein